MTYGQISLTGTTFGRHDTLIIGDVARNNPEKYYHVRCTLCESEWTETHAKLMLHKNSNVGYRCQNTPCRLGKLGHAEQAKQQYLAERERERERDRETQERAELVRLQAKYGQRETK